MATTTAPVIFGWGPDGARSGRVRFEIPDTMNPSTLRSQIRRGQAALQGPQNPSDVGIHRYRLLFRGYRGDGWAVWGTVHVAD
jgi:hypothetical protein